MGTFDVICGMISNVISLVLRDSDTDSENVNLMLLSLAGPEVMKLFSCSTQLSMKFQMLISIKLSRNSAFIRLR